MPENNSQGSFSITRLLTSLKSNPLRAFKVALISVAGLVVLAFALSLINSSFGALTRRVMQGPAGFVTSSIAKGGYGYGGGYGGEMAYDMAAPAMAPMPPSDGYYEDYAQEESVALSVRNVAGTIAYPEPMPQSTVGDDAEDYEVKQYSATIETRHLDDTCGSVAALKARTDVAFENAHTSDHSCSFTFKVKIASVEAVLATIKALDPKDLSEQAYTIKAQIEDFTSETEVLEKKRASIDETLASALSAYNDVTRLATQSQNADALAKIINSKIAIIERLTQERININERLDRLARAKAKQLDQLEYTYFYVSVYERKFFDGEGIFDSWKDAVQNFVYDLNRVVQGATLQFLLLLALIVQWALYALVALFVVKYGWKAGKHIWYR